MKSNELPSNISAIVDFALREDIGSGDITAELIPATNTARASIISRDSGVLCGSPWVDEVFRQIDDTVQLVWHTPEGSEVSDQQPILTITGCARSILTAERSALNFLQTLSATATQSQHYANMVSHTQVRLLDTRKTLPGLRSAQKYAVRVGGCFNHRMGLFDAFLIKENHISACGSIALAVSTAKSLHADKPVEIEVQNLDQLQQALSAAADIVMLDNFSLADTIQAVSLNAHRSKLEASGGINQDTLVKIAETGVDYISIGALTKDCKAIDLSLLLG